MSYLRSLLSKRNVCTIRKTSPIYDKLFSRLLSVDSKIQKLDRRGILRFSRPTTVNFVRTASGKTVLKPAHIFTEKDKNELLQLLPVIISDLTENEEYSDVADVSKKFANLLHYNLSPGTKYFGCIATMACKMLERPEMLTDENLRLANIIGWCVQMHTQCILMEDDIYDASETRRNIPCWYRVKNDFTFINDINFIRQGAFIILKKYFSSHPFYIAMVDILNKGFFDFTYGFGLEVKLKVEDMTREEYLRRAKYNSAVYSYVIPVGMGMCFSKVYSEELFRECLGILHEMGVYLMSEDAMWDVFGDMAFIAKITTDIQEGKCNWVVITALEKADSQQRKLIEEHYGRANKESIELIRSLYVELDLIGEFFAYREACYNKLCKEIHKLSHKPLQSFLNDLCKIIYQRNYIIQ